MANKIILNKFISRLNNAMLAFNFFFKKKNLFLVFKGEKKRKLGQKRKIIFHKLKNHKPKKKNKKKNKTKEPEPKRTT